MVARRLIAVVIAVASAAGIGACGDEYTRGAGVSTTTTTTPSTTTTLAPPAQTTDAGGTENRETARLTAAQRLAVRRAKAAARSFLAGYLPYSYGRRDARTIRSVSPSLRRALARHAPRVPPSLAAKARPRLVDLDHSGIPVGRQVMLLAHIDDGQSRYVALLTVQRRDDRWIVTQVR